MRILGIDPGTAIIGWGVLDERNRVLKPIDYGSLTTLPNQTPAQRLLTIHQRLGEVVQVHKPEVAAVEELFFARNAKTALAVGQARGVILLTLAQAGIPIYEYKPLEIKQAVAGYGAAAKRQMQEMVRIILHLKAIPKPDDTADALAIAICHAYTDSTLRRLQDGA
jgi:crossover junction endodeoxyribonuclease RuvC